MVDDLATTLGAPKRKAGRPPRAAASAEALRGIDLRTCDPTAILREIALDRSQPGSTRVAACKALLGQHDQDSAENLSGDTRVNARAAAMMRRAN
jgi:hypothetical protein